MNAANQRALALCRRDGLPLVRITFAHRNGKVAVLQDVPRMADALRLEIKCNGGTIIKEEPI
jgi:hypothetical protein